MAPVLVRLVAIAFALIALAPTAAVARVHRTVLKATLAGNAGQSFTVFETATPGDYTFMYGKVIGEQDKPPVLVRVVSRDGKGGRVEHQYDSRKGVPLVAGQIERITVQFLEAGQCEVEVGEALP